MRPNRIQWLNGGFEIVNFKPPFSFENEITVGVLKSPIFKDMEVSKRYRYVLFDFCTI